MRDDRATALVLTGQLTPSMVVVGDPGGVLGPVEFLHAFASRRRPTPVIVGVADDAPQLGRNC